MVTSDPRVQFHHTPSIETGKPLPGGEHSVPVIAGTETTTEYPVRGWLSAT